LIPYVKFRGGVRFLPEDIDAFIASRRVAARKIPAPKQKRVRLADEMERRRS
jgi:hypothetical protein